MPTGSAARTRRGCSRGFTYLSLLFALAIGGAALAALGESWATRLQREREAELLFRGIEIRRAIERWYAVAPADSRAAAGGGLQALEDLVADRRSTPPQYHLRRLYADPFTGRPDWRLLRDAQGGVVGVASRSTRPALRRHDLPVPMAADHDPPRVADWQFIAEGRTPLTPPRDAAHEHPQR